jgi:hypothetical protein
VRVRNGGDSDVGSAAEAVRVCVYTRVGVSARGEDESGVGYADAVLVRARRERGEGGRGWPPACRLPRDASRLRVTVVARARSRAQADAQAGGAQRRCAAAEGRAQDHLAPPQEREGHAPATQDRRAERSAWARDAGVLTAPALPAPAAARESASAAATRGTERGSAAPRSTTPGGFGGVIASGGVTMRRGRTTRGCCMVRGGASARWVGARRADAEEDLSLFFPLGAALAIAPCANCARVLVMCRRACVLSPLPSVGAFFLFFLLGF